MSFSVCILTHFSNFEMAKHKTKFFKFKNFLNSRGRWQQEIEKIRKRRRHWGGGYEEGEGKKTNPCTPASLDAIWFLCKWSETRISTNRKSEAMSQKWTSVSWYHNSGGYCGWQKNKECNGTKYISLTLRRTQKSNLGQYFVHVASTQFCSSSLQNHLVIFFFQKLSQAYPSLVFFSMCQQKGY